MSSNQQQVLPTDGDESNGAGTPNGAAGAAPSGGDPSGFLNEILHGPVTVKLNSGVVYKGELQSVDGYMNLALEGVQEIVKGQALREYGDAFVRGNNVMYICAGDEKV